MEVLELNLDSNLMIVGNPFCLYIIYMHLQNNGWFKDFDRYDLYSELREELFKDFPELIPVLNN